MQDLVPDVWELILAQVPVKLRVIYMDVHSLLDVSCDSLWFPVDNGKTFRADCVSCGVAMVVDGVLRYSVPKGSAGFSNVFLEAVYMLAFEFVDYPTLM